MRVKLKLFINIIILLLILNGCANVQNGINSIANGIPDPDKVYKDAKQENNFELNIKKYNDTHYKFDVLFAMPKAKSIEEAILQYNELLKESEPYFNKQYITQKQCTNSTFWINKNQMYPIFYQKTLSDHHTINIYVQLIPIKIGNMYYLIVSNTNVKNRSFGSKLMMIISSGGSEKAMDEVFKDNNCLMQYINLGFFKAIKKNDNLKEYFVNLQIGDKDDLNNEKVKKFRKKFLSVKNKDVFIKQIDLSLNAKKKIEKMKNILNKKIEKFQNHFFLLTEFIPTKKQKNSIIINYFDKLIYEKYNHAKIKKMKKIKNKENKVSYIYQITRPSTKEEQNKECKYEIEDLKKIENYLKHPTPADSYLFGNMISEMNKVCMIARRGGSNCKLIKNIMDYYRLQKEDYEKCLKNSKFQKEKIIINLSYNHNCNSIINITFTKINEKKGLNLKEKYIAIRIYNKFYFLSQNKNFSNFFNKAAKKINYSNNKYLFEQLNNCNLL